MYIFNSLFIACIPNHTLSSPPPLLYFLLNQRNFGNMLSLNFRYLKVYRLKLLKPNFLKHRISPSLINFFQTRKFKSRTVYWATTVTAGNFSSLFQADVLFILSRKKCSVKERINGQSMLLIFTTYLKSTVWGLCAPPLHLGGVEANSLSRSNHLTVPFPDWMFPLSVIRR